MTANRHGVSFLCLSLAMLASAAHANEQSSQGEPTTSGGEAESSGITDIVVTASRRSDSVQRISAAVSVISGETQLDRGQQRLEDLQLSSPNVTFTNASNSALRAGSGRQSSPRKG